MKIRFKFGGQSQRVDLGERPASVLTLWDLKQAVADTLQLNIENVNVSLNQTDVLSGDDTILSDFGIVSGDLVYMIHEIGREDAILAMEQAPQRPQPLNSWSSTDVQSSSNSVASQVLHRNEENLSFYALSQESEDKKLSQSDSKLHAKQNSDPVGAMHHTSVNRFLLEPLVVRESTADKVPAMLDQLFISSQCKNKNEALWVILHTLMIESGFLPSCSENYTVMPNGWKGTGSYSCHYEYVITSSIIAKCTVVGVTLGSSISVHGVAVGESEFQTDHLQLKAEHFVRTLSSHAPSSYRALDRLSRQFKDVVCLPLINHLSCSAGMGEEQGLLALPCELRIRLLSYLDARSICRLGATCNYWNSVYKDNIVWRRLYLADFSAPTDCSLERNWYELYKERHVSKLKEIQHRHRLIQFSEDYPPRHPFQVPPMFRPGGPQPFFPHVVGGDYDLNPHYAPGRPNPMDLDRLSGLSQRNATRHERGSLSAQMFSKWI